MSDDFILLKFPGGDDNGKKTSTNDVAAALIRIALAKLFGKAKCQHCGQEITIQSEQSDPAELVKAAAELLKLGSRGD